MEKHKFKVGDKVRAIKPIESNDREIDNYIENGEICEIVSVTPDYLKIPLTIKCGNRKVLCDEDELELIEKNSVEELQAHKGCDFVNDDFYRAFTGKNGQIIFNKVKVSTVCICKDNFDNLVIATIDSDKRLEPNTKVKLNNDSVATVLKSIKIMNKYLDDLGQALLNSDAKIIPGTLKVVGIKVVGIYKEQKVTKTELVLEEI